MILSLKDINHVPPGGLFVYLQKDTSVRLTASSFQHLLEKVKKHRLANNIPITGTFIQEVQHGVCEQLSAAGHPGECVDAEHPFVPHDRRIAFGLSDAITGTLTIGAFALLGESVVSQPVADARASICSTCEFNVDHGDSCKDCHNALNRIEGIVTQLLGRRSTPSDPSLRSCWHCGCFNKAQVWLPLASLQRFFSEEKNSQLPDHCWKKVKP